MPELLIVITGVAQPQGSLRAFMPKGAKHPVLTSDNPSLADWRRLVAWEAAAAARKAEWSMPSGPVRLTAMYSLRRPKSLPKTKVVPHIKKPDLDKLVRATKDALKGVIYTDDAQVTEVHASKCYAALGVPPSAALLVAAL